MLGGAINMHTYQVYATSIYNQFIETEPAAHHLELLE